MKKIVVVLILLCLLIVLVGCGNSGNLTEGLTNATNTFNYIVTFEAGEYHLQVERFFVGCSRDNYKLLQ